jgi:ATP-dependent exoDNAse (exonuclease V) beta subunit
MTEVRWTPQQAAAITESRHALLVANAGTGKTATVVGKIRWLLGLALEPARDPDDPGASVDLQACPEPCDLREIAAITFTEKAAYDLKRKLRDSIMSSERADELRWEIDRASIGTIHGFCGELLREHALRLEIDPTFQVLDDREAWTAQDDIIADVIKKALGEGDRGAGLLVQRYPLTSGTYQSGVVDHVRKAMHDLRWHRSRYEAWLGADGSLDASALERAAEQWTPELDEPTLELTDALVRLARRALEAWEAYLLAENARDFDALILDARRLLTGPSAAAALAGIRRRYRILIIDEFQDTDGAQRDIAFAIAGLLSPVGPDGPGGPSGSGGPGPDGPVVRPQLFLVGDPKQSIYRFRGADISVWNEVSESMATSGVVLDLTENFRCAPPIVKFVNDTVSGAMGEVGEAITEAGLSSRIPYADLVAAVPPSDTAGLEWLVAEKRNETKAGKVTTKADLAAEAAQVAARIREMVGTEPITDPDDGSERLVRHSDIAVLYRGRTVLPAFEAALSSHGVPYYIAGASHLGDRQEILDLLNLLRLLRNPRDDYRAFGFLRSPFVALRDEVVAHLALHGRGPSLLIKARNFLDGRAWAKAGPDAAAWFDGPEGPVIGAIERAALRRALDTVAAARDLVHRVPLDQVLQFVLDALGYRLHLLVGGGAEEQLANIQSFLQFTEQYRDLDIATFLEVWDRWDSQDNGLPQAPLYSKDDDVVTFSTIHGAKGLEWPVVFLVGTGSQRNDRASNTFWSDPGLGPLLCPSRDDRGERAGQLWRRNDAEEHAEDSRLLYVATTRARDRLIIVGPASRERSYSEWLAEGVDGNPFYRRTEAPETEPLDVGPVPSLAWLEDLALDPAPALLSPTPVPPPRFVVSATELMGRAKDETTWRLRYQHGVQPKWEFAGPFEEGTLQHDEVDATDPTAPADAPAPAAAPAPADAPPAAAARVPATVRGTVIHGVLERIQDEAELSRLLHETIGGLDDPDLEEVLEADAYRQALEEEIRRVVRSEEWAWYVEGEHYRELEFVHFAGEREWRVGAFDLYRPGPPAWVIDFKTHEIDADKVDETAKDYTIQARIYREAAATRGEATVALHFTGPNVVAELPG